MKKKLPLVSEIESKEKVEKKLSKKEKKNKKEKHDILQYLSAVKANN
jgi:hypothetical protein